MLHPSNTKQVFSFSRQLFLSVIVLFLTFVICFMAFQYRREKDYKAELLNTQLQDYNDDLKDYLVLQDTLHVDLLNEYVQAHKLEHLRVTLIDPTGKVLYDNTKPETGSFKNHLDRKEIQQALYCPFKEVLKAGRYSLQSPPGENRYSDKQKSDDRAGDHSI